MNYEFDQVIGSECTEQTNAPQPLSVDTQFDYELSEPNAWVMDRPRYRVGAGEWCESEDILRIDDLLRQQLDWELRTGTMVQPWCDDEAPKQGPGITLEYSFQVSQIPELVDLLIEQPDRWEVSLNGSAITLPNDPEWFIDIALKRISLPMEHFVEGCNRLTLKTRLRADTDLEAIYLLGDFGVFNRGNGYTIEALPETLVVGDLVHQGLPFYTGRVSYLTALTDGPVGADLLCELPQFAAACGRVSVGDVGSVLAFPPYRVHLSTPSHQQSLRIDLTLTRQNLFGPFHRLPKGDIMTAPSSFRTEGVNFSADYELFPSGLLKPPAVCWLTD